MYVTVLCYILTCTLFHVSAETLSSVTDYELVVPSLVDHTGEFVSYDVTDQYHVRMRTKRSISTLPLEQETPDWIYYQLETHGKLFHLNLTLNKRLIAPAYSVDYVGTGGKTETQHRTIRECHYHGYIHDHEDSRVALSNCNGLVSLFASFIVVLSVWPVLSAVIGHSQHRSLFCAMCLSPPSNNIEPF